MSVADISELVGYLVAVWCIGFSGGYTLTKFVQAVNQVG